MISARFLQGQVIILLFATNKYLVERSFDYVNILLLLLLSHFDLCPTLCDPIDGSPRGFPVPGILQARTLEWVAISFSNAWKWKVKVKLLSHVWLLATPWTTAYQAPPSIGFSRVLEWCAIALTSPLALISIDDSCTNKLSG